MKKSFALCLALFFVLTGCGSKEQLSNEQFSNERAYRSAINLDVASSYYDILNDPIAYASEPNEKIGKMISDVFSMINGIRAAENKQPFEYNQSLSECAQIRAEEASVKFDNFSRPNGESWDTIAPYDVLAESLYKSKKADMNSIKSWMENEVDKDNFFSDEYTKIGLGIFLNDKGEYTFAALFGSDTIDISYTSDSERGETWILKATGSNRKKSNRGKAMIITSGNVQEYKLRIPKSAENKYLFRMISNDGHNYQADIPNLKNGFKLKLIKSEAGHAVRLEIFNENDELIEKCTVFKSSL